MSQKNVHSIFNRLSTRYDIANRFLSFGLHQSWRRRLCRHLPENRRLSILDIASGTADQLLALFRSGAIDRAVGLDLSKDMLKIAEKKLLKTPYKNRIQLVLGDAESLPFEEAKFDVCTMSFGLRNLKNPKKALSEMARVTKSGGRCLILEFSLPRHPFYYPFLFYLRTIVPWIGGFITRDREAYRYLNRTIVEFAHAPVLEWLKQSGWSRLQATPLLFGSLILYQGDKT